VNLENIVLEILVDRILLNQEAKTIEDVLPELMLQMLLAALHDSSYCAEIYSID
jgi:hypothetical protein